MTSFRELIERENIHSYKHNSLNEASFNAKKIEQVVKLYSRIMGKKFGAEFKPLGFESYKRKWGPGKGFRMINNKGNQLRFNWDSKLAKSAQYELTSIDYWSPTNTDFQKPTRTVLFSPELNVVQILDKISSALMTGNIRESNKYIEEINLLLESRSKEEIEAFAASKGFPKTGGRNRAYLRAYGKKHGISEEVEIFLGTTETNTFEGELKQVETQLDEQIYANPDTIFEDVEDLLGVVASGAWRTLIVCGQGGVGKSYHITEGSRSLPALLGPKGDKWTYHSGTKASPLSFYKTLFQERDKIVVFDEADAILKSSEIVMMLKPILDTSGDNLAEYLTGTRNMIGKTDDEIKEYSKAVQSAIEQGATVVRQKSKRLYDPFFSDTSDGSEDGSEDEVNMGDADVMLPSKFFFEGGMVFISNMKAAEIEQAIMSRSIFVDIYLAEQDIQKRIRTIGYAQAKSNPDISVEDIDEVLEAFGSNNDFPDQEIKYMTPEYARQSKQLTVRALSLGVILKKSGLPRWRELAALYA